ncbi:DUF58 domain-containing protein [Oceanobacter mangrovi]|uniref:DUF58 domain-containing protein n=1 Tax=Oceanobacter mangrovi TaxID=2862510 RepID=UPI001C8ED7CC|nr:DUF58 domain-containing protein [Oceanobacter mangrovi]
MPESWRNGWYQDCKKYLKLRGQRWLDKRIPGTRRQQLGHRSIFILPTRAGLLFAVMLLIMLVTAINYQSSLIYGLTFWLFSIGLSAMYLTFRNLKGLILISREAPDGYAGQVFEIPLQLQAGNKREHLGLWLGYPDNPPRPLHVQRGQFETLQLSYRSQRRGKLQPGRLLLESRFPLGLFRAWSWIRLDFHTLVYPKPIHDSLRLAGGSDGGELIGATRQTSGDQDFRGLRQYQPGDSMRQIAWKQLARGKGLVTKDFDSDDGASCWLDWANISGDAETRLSILCGAVLDVHQKGWEYGLRLPGVEIKPTHSEAHMKACLTALAVWGEAS